MENESFLNVDQSLLTGNAITPSELQEGDREKLSELTAAWLPQETLVVLEGVRVKSRDGNLNIWKAFNVLWSLHVFRIKTRAE